MELINSPDFEAIKTLLSDICTSKTPHPKLMKLRELLADYFNSFDTIKNNSKAIIFTQSRNTAQEISIFINENQKIQSAIFIGQSGRISTRIPKEKQEKSKKHKNLAFLDKYIVPEENHPKMEEGDIIPDPKESVRRQETDKGNTKCPGMSQKEQFATIQAFKENKLNTLIATCIGEEGLDIGDVDLIICYDSGFSPIRMIQRKGRTGRHRDGKVIVLLMEGKEMNSYMQNIKKSEGLIKSLKKCSMLYEQDDKNKTKGKKELKFYPFNPRMVPEEECPTLILKNTLLAENEQITEEKVEQKKTKKQKSIKWKNETEENNNINDNSKNGVRNDNKIVYDTSEQKEISIEKENDKKVNNFIELPKDDCDDITFLNTEKQKDYVEENINHESKNSEKEKENSEQNNGFENVNPNLKDSKKEQEPILDGEIGEKKIKRKYTKKKKNDNNDDPINKEEKDLQKKKRPYTRKKQNVNLQQQVIRDEKETEKENKEDNMIGVEKEQRKINQVNQDENDQQHYQNMNEDQQIDFKIPEEAKNSENKKNDFENQSIKGEDDDDKEISEKENVKPRNEPECEKLDQEIDLLINENTMMTFNDCDEEDDIKKLQDEILELDPDNEQINFERMEDALEKLLEQSNQKSIDFSMNPFLENSKKKSIQTSNTNSFDSTLDKVIDDIVGTYESSQKKVDDKVEDYDEFELVDRLLDDYEKKNEKKRKFSATSTNLNLKVKQIKHNC